MRFLVFLQAALLRHFDTVFAQLLREGHEVLLASRDPEQPRKIPGAFDGLTGFRLVADPIRKTSPNAIRITRRARNFLRYSYPGLEGAWANRERAWQRLFAAVSSTSRAEIPPAPSFQLNEHERTALSDAFRTIESLIQPDHDVIESLRGLRPDAVLVSPLVGLSAGQPDVVKVARAAGIPSGNLVFSWDNLSNKGDMHVVPDKVYVWNEVMAREAVELHGVQREAVVVTGAPRYDSFFEMQPSVTREEFKQRLRLDPDRPLILYLGSAPFVSPDEPGIFLRWLKARRATPDPLVRDAAVVARPHPRTKEPWPKPRGKLGEGVFIGRRGAMYNLQGLYDEIFAADAVVGLNTSAQIEAAIVGRPVYTFGAGKLAPGQEGTTHFYYLLRENGGFVEYAPSFEEHFEQVALGMQGEFDREALARSVTEFVRPHGVDRPATPILAEALVELGRSGEREPQVAARLA